MIYNLYFMGEVNPQNLTKLTSTVMTKIAEEPSAQFRVVLASTGGNPFTAMGYAAFVKAWPCLVEVVAMGGISSAATVFYASFPKRTSVPSSYFYFHNTTWAFQALPYSLIEIEDIAGQIKANRDHCFAILGKASSINKKQFLEWTATGHTMDVAEALLYGYVQNLTTDDLTINVMDALI